MKEFKVKKGDFTTTYNDIFRAEIDGQKLTPESWGLYIFMLSLPDSWDFTILGLTSVVNAGKNKIQRMLKELEDSGFIKREQKQSKDGRFGSIEYTVMNKPISPYAENRETVEKISPYPQKPYTDFEPQQNTNKQSNIDKLIDKGQNLPHQNHYLTNYLIEKKLLDLLSYDVIKFNELFSELDKQYNYELVMIATRYLISFISKNEDIDSVYAYFKTSIINNLIELSSKANTTPKFVKDFIKELELMELESW